MNFMVIIILFVLFLLMGMPIAYVLGISGMVYLYFKGGALFLLMAPDKVFSGINSFALLAVPFFMIAGEVMNKAEISGKILEFCDLTVGKIRGGVGYVSIMASFIFAGISGSAISEVTALGSILIPTMEKSGYKKSYSAALIAAASVLGPIIPPSILAVIYGSMTGLSVGAIFAAAIAPGILISLALVFVLHFTAKKMPIRKHSFGNKTVGKTLGSSIWAVLMPVIIVGSILGGIATPTESAVLAILYALFIAFFIYRTLKIGDLKDILVDACKSSTILLFLTGTAGIFSWMLAMEQVPQYMANFFSVVTDNPTIFLLLVVVLLLFVGTFLEITAAAIILVPILAPVAVSMGVDSLHFAIVFLLADFIGVITPPVGVCLFASASISKESIEKVSFDLLPFLGAEIAALLVIVFWPELVLFLPRMLKLI